LQVIKAASLVFFRYRQSSRTGRWRLCKGTRWHFDQPRLDRFHEPEVGHHPFEEAGPRPGGGVDPHGGGGEVVDDAGLAAPAVCLSEVSGVAEGGDGVEPDGRGFRIPVFGALVSGLAGEPAVMGFIVDDHQVAVGGGGADQLSEHPFGGVSAGLAAVVLADAQQLAGVSGGAEQVAGPEGLPVDDGHLRPVEIAAHRAGRNQPVLVVDVVGAGGLEHRQAVADGEAGGDDGEALSVPQVPPAGGSDGVEGLPGDQHRHDHGLAGAGGLLDAVADQPVVVPAGQLLYVPALGGAAVGDLPQPDQGFDGFALGEEGLFEALLAVGPMAQEPPGYAGRPRITLVPPGLHPAPDGVDGLVQVLGGHLHSGLRVEVPGVSGGGTDRRGPAAALLRKAALHRPAQQVELPVPVGFLVGRAEHRVMRRVVADRVRCAVASHAL